MTDNEPTRSMEEVSLTQPSDLGLYVIFTNGNQVEYKQIGLINNLFIDVGRSKVPIFQFGREDQIGYIQGFRNVYGEMQMVQIELDAFAEYYQTQREVITDRDYQFYKNKMSNVDQFLDPKAVKEVGKINNGQLSEQFHSVKGFTADMLNGIDIMVQSQPRMYLNAEGKRMVEYIQQKITNFQIVSDSYASSVSGLFTARQIQFYADKFEPLTRREVQLDE